MRHLTNMMYASSDIPENKCTAYSKHMGHSKTINENIYQTPLAETEVLEVLAILTQFGKFHYIARFRLKN